MPAWSDNAPVGNPVERGTLGALMMVMAASLLVFIRRDIGVRLLPRVRVVSWGIVLVIFSGIGPPYDPPLAVFAALFVLLAFLHHWRHMRRIRRGSPEWHSYSTGRSLIFSLAPLPLPKALVHAVIEPALCGLLGWWLLKRGGGTYFLGWWVVIASVFLFIIENTIRVARRESLLDLGDTVIESVNFAGRAENFTKGAQRPRGSAAKARANPSRDSWLRARWQVWQASRQSRRAKREAEERQRQQQEEAQARARHEQEEAARQPWRDPTAGRMTPEQALEILELTPGATALDIRAAYNRLMRKVHPDTGGSTFFARQLNLARDTLLIPQRKSG